MSQQTGKNKSSALSKKGEKGQKQEYEVTFKDGKKYVNGEEQIATAQPKQSVQSQLPSRRASRRGSVSSIGSVMMRDVMGEALYNIELEKKKEHLMRDFFKEEIDRIQQEEIIQKRKQAKLERDEAIKKREEIVNPLMEELLFKHYGVAMPEKKRNYEPKWPLKKCQKKVGDLYAWQNAQQEKKEILVDSIHDQENNTCPFTPNLSNYSRYLIDKKGKKIKQKIEQRHKEVMEVRQTGKLASEKENEQQLLSQKKSTKKREAEGDTFLKRMDEWMERRDKLLKEKMVEKWVKEHEDDTNQLNSDTKKKRASKLAQEETVRRLNMTKKSKEEHIKQRIEDETKGLFVPKTTKYIPGVIKQEFEKRKKEKLIKQYEILDKLYQDNQERFGEEGFLAEISQDLSSEKLSQNFGGRISLKKSFLNIVEVEEEDKDANSLNNSFREASRLVISPQKMLN